ncbi:hypothetical protein HELRODRAFT_159772 [Helobdella robusta]|uniref:Nematode cuticle collagen N-terminal domain-containing protein n=1 Tax=Helobdella robusta TaxID=6412 RepID=T1EPE0_HELRO|nr:hypothetical protein HELRODRAFT_159772 [Helobdella robusta]ESO13147.1 hypothetical protein HELRODRAFT_159772 [Helobdella robusta]
MACKFNSIKLISFCIFSLLKYQGLFSQSTEKYSSDTCSVCLNNFYKDVTQSSWKLDKLYEEMRYNVNSFISAFNKNKTEILKIFTEAKMEIKAPGYMGRTGVPGDTGSTGNTGWTGKTGQPGMTGSPGLTGFPGFPGDPGLMGYTGLPGNTGYLEFCEQYQIFKNGVRLILFSVGNFSAADNIVGNFKIII